MKLQNYSYILATIILTVYGQLILKLRIMKYGTLPIELYDKVKFFINLFLDPLIFSGFLSAFLASITWMAAMTKFDLSHAYPFMSLNFIFVVLFSNIIFNEAISLQKIIGVLLIVLGTVVASKN